MRSARSEIWPVAFLLFLTAFILPAFAVEEDPRSGQFLKEFETIQARLAGVEQAQRDILAQKTKIISEIDRLRVWVRHSGGK